MSQWLPRAFVFLVVVVPAIARADEPPTATAKAAFAWEYPGAKNLVTSEGGPLYTSIHTTSDDLASVVAYYEKKLATKIALDKPEAGGGEGGRGKHTAVHQDSLRPAEGGKKAQSRDVTLLLASQTTKEYCLTLVISQAKGEKQTHIALTYVFNQE
jgi:hypothetical protein